MPQTLALTLANTAKKQQPTCHIILMDDNQQPLTPLKDNLSKRVTALVNSSYFAGKVAETVTSYAIDGQDALLIVGVGQLNKLSGTALQKIAKAIYSSLAKHSQHATLYLDDRLDEVQFGQLMLAILNSSYTFDSYKSTPSEAPRLTEISVVIQSNTATDWQALIDLNNAIYHGQTVARDLANAPPNICYPAYLAQQAMALASQYPDVLQVHVVGEKDMAKLGMNCFLAVSRGSEHEGQLVLMEYNGIPSTQKRGKKSKKSTPTLQNPIVMVGKGITFDTGGISLKPGAGMGEMKFDMGGAAAVLGMMTALCEAALPLQVVGALACAENMPSGRASRPGDIVTAMNGKTVEILNTDAEGRLVLCDTLVYVQRYQPKVIIDMATLTGACVVALGSVRTALYSNDEDVLFELEQASETAHDRVWHMPLDDDYQEQLNSNMADMQNIGGAPAGSVTAACFLSRFVDDIPWAHLDIAGTAWQAGKEPTGTGRPVPLLMHYLYREAQKPA